MGFFTVCNGPDFVATSIDVTEACTLACDYCFTFSDHPRRSISEKTAASILEWWIPRCAKTQNAIDIGWWGGEPLMEWDLIKRLTQKAKDIASYYGYEITFSGTSNGTLLTPDKVEWCLKNRTSFMVSVDGPEFVHDKHRKFANGQGSWKVVDKNIREAIRMGAPPYVRASLTSDNIPHLLETIQYFTEDLGVRYYAISPVYEGNWDKAAFELLEDQYTQVIKYIIGKYKEEAPVILKHLNDEIASIQTCKPVVKGYPCGAGNTYSGWSIDGQQFPCHRFNKHGLTCEERKNSPVIIASMQDDGSIKEVNPEWRQKFIDFMKDLPEKCKQCEIYETSCCRGGCYAVAYDHNKELIAPDIYCEYSKLLVRAAHKFLELYEEAGLTNKIISSLNMYMTHNPHMDGTPIEGCVCNNCCYSEGTANEIIHVDRRNNQSCLCYHERYTQPDGTQFRTIFDIDKQKELDIKIVDLARKILLTKNEEKTEEQLLLEDQILESLVTILKRVV